MAVTDRHPEHNKFLQDWQLMEDSLIGESEIKLRTTHYLAKTAGMIEAEKEGDATGLIYRGYISRAQYQHWVKDSLRSMIGLVSQLEPEINLPHSQLKVLLDNATSDGFGLKQLFTRIVNNILSFGRCVLLVDFDDNGQPFIACYPALSVINWKVKNVGGRADLTLAVLRETRDADDADEFSHTTNFVYRVLDVIDGAYRVRVLSESGEVLSEVTPSIGSQSIKFIPIVFCGSIDNSPDVDELPLLTMAKAALKHYQLSADYFQSLHHTAHPQPYVIGLDNESNLSVTGAMAAWDLPLNSSCGYLEVTGVGIELTKSEMDAQKNAALESGAKVLDVGGVESGTARKARQGDQHATLYNIVTTAAEGIEQCLKYAAEWLGLSPTDCKFTVKPEFAEVGYDILLAQQLYNAAIAGIVSAATYWDYVRTGKLPEFDYQTELARIENPNPSDVPA